jgi:ABC-type siderophore export system fused ATPase/permease subunit
MMVLTGAMVVPCFMLSYEANTIECENIVSEVIANIFVIRLNSMEQWFCDRYKKSIIVAYSRKAEIYINAFFKSMAFSSIYVIQAITFHYGSELLATNEYSIKNIIAVYVGILFIGVNLLSIIRSWKIIKNIKPICRELIEFLRSNTNTSSFRSDLKYYRSLIQFPVGTNVHPELFCPRLGMEIRLENVFTSSLENLNLLILSSEKIFVVEDRDKSFFKLLSGLIKPSRGNIFVRVRCMYLNNL